MQEPHSVSEWLEDVKNGDAQAVHRLWERYFDRLLRLARQHLPPSFRRVADEEDVVLSAFHSFFEGAASDRFPDLKDRDNLWALLVFITRCKAADQVHHQMRQKRGNGKVRGESAFESVDQVRAGGIEEVLDEEPTPEFALSVAEEVQKRVDRLPEADLRCIARRKLEGFTNEEIAAELDYHPVTISRKLQRIRAIWTQESVA